jgi:formate hydrogenlyase subunit 4
MVKIFNYMDLWKYVKKKRVFYSSPGGMYVGLPYIIPLQYYIYSLL